jgi:hypothetical protein
MHVIDNDNIDSKKKNNWTKLTIVGGQPSLSCLRSTMLNFMC